MGGAPQPHAGAVRVAAASARPGAALDAALQLQQLHREQQSPASNPPAAAGTSAPHAPAGSAGCAPSTASSSAQNAPAQEESPALDLGLEIEKMIREIRNSLPVKAPSAQVLLTTDAAIRTKERGWIHASKIKGPVEEPKEWTITSEPGSWTGEGLLKAVVVQKLLKSVSSGAVQHARQCGLFAMAL
ncbi:hypothetical protein DUI87_09996 [Hirundo rustica rustica]|uniref:Uncharacterized protein n=1 Tax=Hirundo rustica rustica TaxID=333673 RepID=A0A3M0KGV0_HIRRU|nr:hypothetical protein DUI87_09996 [Hirundo rustica rustica]